MAADNSSPGEVAKRKHWLPFAVTFGYLVFAFLTLSRQYTYDAISYLWDIEHTHLGIPLDANAIAYNFFHSQHLFFSLFPYLFFHVWKLFGYSGSALVPAQAFNLLEGAAAFLLLFRQMSKRTGDTALAAVVCILIGATFAYWNDTAMISDHMSGCLLGLLFFDLLCDTSLRTASAARLMLLGFLNGAAMLMHQVNGLLGVLFLVALWSEHLNAGIRIKALLIYCAAAVLTVSLPYGVIGIYVLDNTTLHDFVFWCFYYAMPGVIDVAGHYGTISFAKFVQLLTGFGASLVGGFYWMNRVFEIRLLQRYGVPLFSMLGAISFIGALIFARRSKPRNRALTKSTRVRRLAGSWFISYAILLFWWGPWYYQLWAIPLMGGAIYFAVWTHDTLEVSVPNQPGVFFGLIAAFLCLLSANSIGVFLPAHDITNNDYYTTTLDIGGRTKEGDLIVVPGNDEYDTYIPYFTKRKIVSLHALLVDNANDLPASLASVRDSIDATWDKKRSVYLFSELHDTAKVYREMYDLHNLTDSAVAGYFRLFPVADTLEAGEIRLYKLAKRPRN
ncbi:MAG TPA: SipW-dependent-type signal peptide-containing protein [Bacteroidota bacterium]|nr:SipW-dependent-type signal peptide-containing protein [Bacteroidota bacterium]